MEQQDLLQDLEQEIYLERASTGARFANYLIDVVVFIILFLVGYGMVLVANLSSRYGAEQPAAYGDTSDKGDLLFYVVYYASILLYFTVFEGATKGRTLGKLITGTRAVQTDGLPITWKNALIRSLCRLVPFEPFSAFGNPWHDTWSNTMVIKIRK